MSLKHNLQRVENRIQSVASDRKIKLLAVSKAQPTQAIAELAQLGQRDFGENYCQEALLKRQQLSDLDIVWHFIGRIQSNKTGDIAMNFDWVHTVDRIKIAKRLNQHRTASQNPLNILVQVNLDNEASKSGVASDELWQLVDEIIRLPRVVLRGLMCIAMSQPSYQRQLGSFKRMATMYQKLQHDYPSQAIDTLSMGMSADLEAAISAGSTMVRVGTAIFGQRANK